MTATAGQATHLSLKDLWDQATSWAGGALVSFAGDMLGLARDSFPGMFSTTEFSLAPLKSEQRATLKVVFDYHGDHTRLTDLVRGRIVVETPEQIAALRKIVAQYPDIVQVKDRFASPTKTGWRDMTLLVRLGIGQNNHIAELRIEHPAMIAAAEETHGMYETIQKLERGAANDNRALTDAESLQCRQFTGRIRAIHDIAAQVAGLDTLLHGQKRPAAAKTAPLSLTKTFTPDSGRPLYCPVPGDGSLHRSRAFKL